MPAPPGSKLTGFAGWYRDNRTLVPTRTLIDGGIGADTMIGSIIDDTYVVDDAGDQVIETGFYGSGAEKSKADRVVSSISYTLGAHVEQLQLQGTAAISGTGNDLNNLLDGASSSGANVLSGGKGDDVYRLGAADTVVEEAGQGSDTVVVTTTATGPVVLSSWANVENLRAEDPAGGVALTGDDGVNVLTGNSSSNILRGMDGNDTLYDLDTASLDRNALGQLIYPSDADELYGGAGDDTLYSASGADLLDGGAGNDVLVGNGNAYRVLFGAGSGQDTLTDDRSQRLETGWTGTGPVLQRIELTAGTDSQTLRFAQSGDSLVISLAGTGDSLTVASFFEEDSSAIRSGIDTLVLSDGTVLTREAIRAALGRGNRITATTGDDLLIARPTGSTLDGGDGADYLVGGLGADVLLGGAGDDRLFGADGADVLDAGAGNDLLVGGRGGDSYRFSAGWGNDTIDDLQSSAGTQGSLADDGAVDEIVFDAGVALASLNFRLDGNNLIISRSGTTDAIKVLGYLDSASASGSVEQIRFADGTLLVRADVVRLASVRHGTAGDDVMVALASVSELHGEAGNDVLTGAAGNDVLDGGSGGDFMQGGAGDDTFVVDDWQDFVGEEAGEGVDTVQSSISYALLTNVENLTLTGQSAIDGTGNALANVLRGNTAANRLDGGAGADTLTGGSGSDTLVGGLGNDMLEGDFAPTQVVIRARASLAEGVGAQMQLWLNGAKVGEVSVNNTAYSDYQFFVNAPVAADAKLDVVFTNDTIVNGQDRNLWIDTVTVGDHVMHSKDSGVVIDKGAGAAAFDGLNTIAGQSGLLWNGALRFSVPVSAFGAGAGDDILQGGEGNDTLDGGAGKDTLYGGAGTDGYVFGKGYGQDQIADDGSGDGSDVVIMNAGLSPQQVSVRRSGNDLVLGIDGEADRLTIASYFSRDAAHAPIGSVTFDDGTVWEGSILKSRALIGTSSEDELIGYNTDDTLVGGAGSDILWDDSGNNLLLGDAAPMPVVVRARASLAQGVGAQMQLWVNGKKVGEALVQDTDYADYRFNVNFQAGADAKVDVVFVNDAVVGGQDRNLWVDAVTVGDHVMHSSDPGVVLDKGANASAFDGMDTLTGQSGLYWNGALRFAVPGSVFGVPGDDRLHAGNGNDTLLGGEGDDDYMGGEGDDLLIDSSLTSADRYYWGSYDGGVDVIDDAGGNDQLLVDGGKADQLWFSRAGNDLDISVIGTRDHAIVRDWYEGSSHVIETIVSSDGKALSDSDVQKLVDAMASFAAPAAGQTELPPNYRDSLLPVLAGNWH